MRVLVVDDEPSIRTVVRHALEGTEVLEAEDAPAAMEVLASEAVDVVLLDVMMPGIDGFELLRKLRASAEHGDVNVIMLTALTGEREHLVGYRAGADAYLTKPFAVEELAAVIGEVCGRTDKERETVRDRELGRAELLHHIESQFLS